MATGNATRLALAMVSCLHLAMVVEADVFLSLNPIHPYIYIYNYLHIIFAVTKSMIHSCPTRIP